MEGGRIVPWQKDLYIGVVCKGDTGQQTIPFFKGLPVEYEIVRTINAVSGSQRKRLSGVRHHTDSGNRRYGNYGICLRAVPQPGNSSMN